MNVNRPLCNFFVYANNTLVEVRNAVIFYGAPCGDYRLEYNVITPKVPTLFRGQPLMGILVKRGEREDLDKQFLELIEYILPSVGNSGDGLLRNLERLNRDVMTVVTKEYFVSGLSLAENYAGKNKMVIGLNNPSFMNIVNKALDNNLTNLQAVQFALDTGIFEGTWKAFIPDWFSDPK